MADVLKSDLQSTSLKRILTTQYERWWDIHIARFTSKAQFLCYAGRYVRGPPIAQHRFTEIADSEVVFLRKDLKEKKWMQTRYSVDEFVDALAEQVPDRFPIDRDGKQRILLGLGDAVGRGSR